MGGWQVRSYDLEKRTHLLLCDVELNLIISLSQSIYQVKVGALVKLQNNESVPADLVVLNTSNTDGMCYVETANLDG